MEWLMIGLGAAVLFVLDLWVMRSVAPCVFRRIYGRLWGRWGILYGLLVAAGALIWNGGADAAAVVSLFLAAVILWTRSRFGRTAARLRPTGPEGIDRWLVFDAVTVVLQWTLLVVFLGGPLHDWMDRLPSASRVTGVLLLNGGLSAAMVVLIVLRLRRYRRLDRWGILGLRRNSRSLAVLTVGPALAGIGLAAAGTFLFLSRSVQPVTPMGRLLEDAGGGTLVLFAAMAVLAAPLLEEIIFRGFFFEVGRRWVGTLGSGALVAAVFTGLHMDQYRGDAMAVGMIAVVGGVLSLVRAAFGSTLASMALHLSYNAGMLVFPVVGLAVSAPACVEYAVQKEDLKVADRRALLRRCIEERPRFKEAYRDLAGIELDEGGPLDEAELLVARGLQLDGDDRRLLFLRLRILMRRGREEAASLAARLRKRSDLSASDRRFLDERFPTAKEDGG